MITAAGAIQATCVCLEILIHRSILSLVVQICGHIIRAHAKITCRTALNASHLSLELSSDSQSGQNESVDFVQKPCRASSAALMHLAAICQKDFTTLSHWRPAQFSVMAAGLSNIFLLILDMMYVILLVVSAAILLSVFACLDTLGPIAAVFVLVGPNFHVI